MQRGPIATRAIVANEPHDPVGREHGSVGTEAPVAGERAPSHVRRVVHDHTDQQRQKEEPVVVQHAARDRAHRRDRADHRHQRENAAERRRTFHERAAADALRAPVRECSPDLLLERLEEARGQRKDDDPQAEDGLVVNGRVRRRELAIRQREKRVRRDSAHCDTGADDVGALGEGQPANRSDQSLPAFSHETWMLPAVSRLRDPTCELRLLIRVNDVFRGLEAREVRREHDVHRTLADLVVNSPTRYSPITPSIIIMKPSNTSNVTMIGAHP